MTAFPYSGNLPSLRIGTPPPTPNTSSTMIEAQSTLTDIVSARPVANHQSYAVAPSSAPGAQTDYHGLDLVIHADAAALTNSNVSLYALEVNAQHSSANAARDLVPIYAFGNNLGGGTATRMKLLRLGSQHTNASVTTSLYGTYFTVPAISGGSTITNLYGHYIESVRGLTGVTNAYALYVAGGVSQFLDQVNISNSGAFNALAIGHTGAQVAFSINTNNSGAAGFYPFQINGYDYGPNFFTAIDGGVSLTVSKNGTAAGTAVQFVNKGTGLTLDVRSGSASLFAITSAGLPKWVAAGNVQATVGAAGAASALPATPSKYLKVVGDDGVTYVVPAYAAS